MPPALLRLRELTVVRNGKPVFEPLNLDVTAGQTTVVQGGNASGKTSLYRALLSSDPAGYRGRLRFEGVDLERGGKQAHRHFLSQTAFVAEDAPTELLDRELLGERGARSLRELSHGTRLRMAVNLALEAEPHLLVIDEAPDGMDEFGRQELMQLLRSQQAARKLGILVLCRDVGPWGELRPNNIVQLEHEAALPLETERIDAWDCLPTGLAPEKKALLSCQSVSVALASSEGGWRKRRSTAQALHAVSFELGWGETLAVVGATPSGKSTLALALAGVLEPTLGRVIVRQRDPDRKRSGPGASRVRAIQLCFDDPKSALDPRLTAHQLLVEALLIGGWPRDGVDKSAEEALSTFGLATASERRPHQLSSGEASLLGLARALSLRPAVLLLDNALAALDRARRASVLGLLHRRRKAHASQVLITNDLTLAHEAGDHLAVLYGGTLVEWGPTERVFSKPAHPYTRALLSQEDRETMRLQLLLEGAPPDPKALPSGCVFHPRCARFAEGRCDRDEPELSDLANDPGHKVACFRPHD